MNISYTEKNKGKFIVIEGIAGCGKGTQISLLYNKLIKSGIPVKQTAEPTNTTVGGIIRDALSGRLELTIPELAALFMADRVTHNINSFDGIKMTLEDGFNIICDRYYYSSFAYQGLDCDMQWVMDINLKCPDIMKPDLCIFLDLPADISKKRMKNANRNLELYEKDVKKSEQIRNNFYKVFEILKNTQNIKIIDANRPCNVITDEIYNCVIDIINS